MSQKIHIRSASASNRVRPLAATQKYHRIFTPGEEVIKAAQTHFVRYVEQLSFKLSFLVLISDWRFQ